MQFHLFGSKDANTSESASFWGQARSRLLAFGRGVVVVLKYIFFFEWVVDIAHWLITTGGNIAESAFLLATVYVTINTVAHQLVLWVLPGNAIVTMNQVSVIAFSVLPELIIFAAIKVTFDHFKMAFATRRIDAWVWSILYVIPTLVFLGLTIITISSFVSVESVNAATNPQASGIMLVVRCLAGWSYGMLQMLWSKLGHEGYSNLFARLRAEIVTLTSTLAVRDRSVADLEQSKAGLEAQVVTLTDSLSVRDLSLSTLQRDLSKRDVTIVDLEEDKAGLQNRVATLGSNLSSRDQLVADLEQSKAGLQNKVSGLDSGVTGLQQELDKRDRLIVDLQQDKVTLQSQLSTLSGSLRSRDSSATGLQNQLAALTDTLASRDRSIATLQSELQDLKERNSTLSGLQGQLANLADTLALRDRSVGALQTELEELKEQNSTLDSELVDARMALARKSGAVDGESDESLSEVVVNSEKYQLVKQLMQQQLTATQKINMKKVSADSGVSYNTVRRYSQSILNGLVA